MNRLVSASLGSTGIQYSYNATGNRTAKAVGGSSYPNTIAPTSNKLTQTQDVLGTATIQHDAAGNITSDGSNTYTYSDRGRLATMTNAGGTVTYSYNALEQRVGKTGPTALVPTGATYYVYNEAGKLLGEYDANGTPQYETVYLSRPVGVMVQTGSAANSNIAVSLYNVSTDQIGAPRVITRSSDEAIVWRWDSAEAFGATAPDQNPSGLGTFTFNQRLPGQVFDAESGLFQNWNREYNPRVGRYMQSDPIGLEGGINTFAYVENDPLSFMDPEGLVQIYESNGVSFHSYPGQPAGGNEHARAGEGKNYHIHLKDSQGREARMSTETWKPLTPEDDKIFRSSRQMQKACEGLRDVDKKFFDRVNRQIFHRGIPTPNQSQRMLRIRFPNRFAGSRSSD